MRAPSFVLAAVALTALGAALWLSGDRSQPDGGHGNNVVPRDDRPPPDDGAGPGPSLVPGIAAPDTAASADGVGATKTPGRTADPIRASELVMAEFHGAALIQRDGERPTPVTLGSISLEVWLRGVREPIEAEVQNGRFTAEIPSIARVRPRGGVFDGERVRFPAHAKPFDPTDEDYALVGVPFPTNVLRVVDGGQRSPLTGVRVRRAEGATAPLLAGQVDEGALIVDDGVAPIVLPWIESPFPVWLRVTAPGYAATNVLVDPNKPAEKEVALWPSADLLIRVTGEGRGNVRALVLFREEGPQRSPACGTLKPTAPGVRTTLSEILFDLKGLAGLPHRIVAKGYDGKGRAIDLAETRVDLGAGAAREVTLRIGG